MLYVFFPNKKEKIYNSDFLLKKVLVLEKQKTLQVLENVTNFKDKTWEIHFSNAKVDNLDQSC
jgi:hypothetical protein